jgi:hypothetical protein
VEQAAEVGAFGWAVEDYRVLGWFGADYFAVNFFYFI